jgi:hypothetical protein
VARPLAAWGSWCTGYFPPRDIKGVRPERFHPSALSRFNDASGASSYKSCASCWLYRSSPCGSPPCSTLIRIIGSLIWPPWSLHNQMQSTNGPKLLARFVAVRRIKAPARLATLTLPIELMRRGQQTTAKYIRPKPRPSVVHESKSGHMRA